MQKSKWFRTTEETPPIGEEVEITHPQFIGTRTAKMYDGAGWHFTDCEHPMMNAFVPTPNSGWRYILSDQQHE